GCFSETPVLSRNEGAFRIEEILAVLHVEHGIASIGVLVVTGRQIDRHFTRVGEDLRSERERLQASTADDETAVFLAAERALQRATARGCGHGLQNRISR